LKYFTAAILCLTGIVLLCAWTIFPNDRVITKRLNSMTLEQKAGQLFMVGNFAKGVDFDKLFAETHFGNVFLGFEDINALDAAQITALTARLQAAAAKQNGIKLLVATDQEGGKVNRVKKIVTYPNQEHVGAKMSIAEAEKLAEHTASQLRAIGINVNFAPVVDVNTNKASHIAKNGRSFSDDPAKVAEYAAAYMRGFKKGGVIGCAKHFPGYGDAAPDPHKNLPSTKKTLEELRKCELVPYAALIKQKNVDMIMTAHILTPAVPGAGDSPATVSNVLMQGVLRDKMGYKGVIVTDDFNMGAMEDELGVDELAVRSINAGVDILLFVGDVTAQKKALDGVLKAVRDGRITEKRLDESVRRVLALKKRYTIDF
jgi:beta-N-acetylhexosaminidase